MKLWEGLGYYRRVRNMQKAAKQIMAENGASFPRNYGEILALCGVGEYTAGAIGSFAFDLPVPAVDGNVLRVVARLCAYGEDVLSPAAKRAVTAAVAEAIPLTRAADFNQALIELGAIVCLPNGAPKCEVCPLADVCRAHTEGVETQLPVRKKPAPRKIIPKTVLILRDGERVALCRRPDTGLLAGLYEPPTADGHLNEAQLRALLLESGIEPLYLTPLENAKHIFTHLEWHMVGFEVVLREQDAAKIINIPLNGMEKSAFFAPREEIDETYAIPGAYRAYRPYM
jgi:A/G-specific adenine glycosylase